MYAHVSHNRFPSCQGALVNFQHLPQALDSLCFELYHIVVVFSQPLILQQIAACIFQLPVAEFFWARFFEKFYNPVIPVFFNCWVADYLIFLRSADSSDTPPLHKSRFCAFRYLSCTE